MAIEDITNPEWVRNAMKLYRELGEVRFLEDHGFAPSTKFDVLDDQGRRYPPKAILGVAHGFRSARSKALTSRQMMGGKPTNRPLERLGFTIVPKDTVDQLLVSSSVGTDDGFDPSNLEDARQRVTREIVQRRGQTKFRNALLNAYQYRCAISGCEVLHVLEAAHVVPYLGERTNHVTNGLLLRADLHTLFDLDLIAVNPENLKIFISPDLKGSEYQRFNNRKIAVPRDPKLKPNVEALERRWHVVVGE